MAASTIPASPPIFSSSQSSVTLSLSHKEKKQLNTKLNQGNNSAPLSLAPFGGIPPLKSRQNPKFRTFIGKVQGGSVDSVETDNGRFTSTETDENDSDCVNGEQFVGCLSKEDEFEIQTRNNPDFVGKDPDFHATDLDGYTKIPVHKRINNSNSNLNLNLNSGIKPSIKNLLTGDYVKGIISLPIEERIKVLDLLQRDNKTLTISDYNDISYALLKAGEFESVVSIFSELKSNGISPDSRSFSILINCLCKKNDPFEAKRVMDEMLESGFKPNIITFSIVVQSLCKRGRVTIALKVLDKMRELNVNPTIDTYNYLMKGLCYVGRLEEAYELIQNLKNTPTQPNIYSFTLIIDAYCKVGMVNRALEIFSEAKEMGLEPTVFTYNAILNGFCNKDKRPKEALSLLIEMHSNNCLPDSISYNIVLQGLLKNREISLALKTFKKMRLAGFQPGERTMNGLLRGLCRLSILNKSFLKDAKVIFEMIKELGFGPSTYTYCLMIQALGKSGEIDKAVVYLNEMVKSGTSPRILTYNMIIRLLCKEGRVYEALGVMSLMIKYGKMPSGFSFSVVLNEFGKQGKFLEAFAVYGAALKRGLNPIWRFKSELVCKRECESEERFVEREREEEKEEVLV